MPAIQNWNNPNEDGFSLVPGFYATITLLLAFEIFRRLSNAMGG